MSRFLFHEEEKSNLPVKSGTWPRIPDAMKKCAGKIKKTFTFSLT
jgi:hypothetical protein